jgi:hypothetical protein
LSAAKLEQFLLWPAAVAKLKNTHIYFKTLRAQTFLLHSLRAPAAEELKHLTLGGQGNCSTTVLLSLAI